jgi:tetratricopeptide (TPR) repeat protein
VAVEEVEPLALKGKESVVPAYRLLEVARDIEGFERRLDSPMVGRDDELALLEGTFHRAARDRISLLFTVLGSAGVGKSRLIQEFVRLVGDEGTVLRGRCLAYGDGITYWPLVEIVKRAARITELDPPDEAVERIAFLVEGSEQRDAIAARVAEAVGVIDATVASEDIAWAVRRLFEEMARDRPLVVVFDDIHWAEPALLDLIEHIADWSRDAPILLLCVARQELLERRPAWGGGKLNATTIQLEPLTEEQSRLLVTHLLGESELDERTRIRITEATEGNPLFVEQMLSMLIDDGLLVRSDSRWVPAGPMPDVTVPPTIHALVGARLDRLGAEERAIIERAAVEGKVFHVGAVVAATEEEARPRVLSHLMGLTRRELVRPERAELQGEEAFRFRHQLIRDATYQGIPKEVRAKLHEAFARWLTEKAGDRVGEYEEILGYHLEQAYLFRRELGQPAEATGGVGSRAGTLLAQAGHRAMARGDSTAAMKLLDRARRLAPGRTRTFVETSLAVSEAAGDAGEFALGQEAADQAADVAGELGDAALLARARVALLASRAPTDPDLVRREGPALVHEVAPILEASDDDRAMAKAWELVAYVANLAADRTAMGDAIDRILEHARRAGDRAYVTDLLAWRAANDYWGPMPADEGIRRYEETLPELEEAPLYHARARMFLAGFLGMQGSFDEARRVMREVKELLRERGDRLRLATTGFIIGPLEVWAGNPEAAESELRQNCADLEAMGERSLLCSIAGFLADVLYVRGRLNEAEEWAQRARGWSSEGDVQAQADWRCVTAKILARRGDVERAEALAAEGLELAQRSDEIEHIGDAWADVAEVHRLADRETESRQAARQALHWYERKGNVAAAGLVRRSYQIA